mmetsp:Transcript_19360/g.45233  ORF Transcript_19360/g.45233 Transcript_19360/m.45233 type:complete len:223 (+) Transcript_19360:1573-2241(+)
MGRRADARRARSGDPPPHPAARSLRGCGRRAPLLLRLQQAEARHAPLAHEPGRVFLLLPRQDHPGQPRLLAGRASGGLQGAPPARGVDHLRSEFAQFLLRDDDGRLLLRADWVGMGPARLRGDPLRLHPRDHAVGQRAALRAHSAVAPLRRDAQRVAHPQPARDTRRDPAEPGGGDAAHSLLRVAAAGVLLVAEPEGGVWQALQHRLVRDDDARALGAQGEG